MVDSGRESRAKSPLTQLGSQLDIGETAVDEYGRGDLERAGQAV